VSASSSFERVASERASPKRARDDSLLIDNAWA